MGLYGLLAQQYRTTEGFNKLHTELHTGVDTRICRYGNVEIDEL